MKASRPIPWRDGYWPVLFALFLASHTLLAFGPLSLSGKLWTFLAGILIPLLLAVLLLKGRASTAPPAFLAVPAPRKLLWPMTGLFTAAVLLRFHQLTTLSLWPLTDESMNAFFALEAAEKGKLQLVYDFSQLPPLFNWGLGAVFKAVGVSLFSLWVFPALLSSLAVGMAYLAARRFFPRGFSLLFAGLAAVSFWPLYAGRFAVAGNSLLLWEYFTFFVLADSLKRIQEGKWTFSAAAWLGACVGLGFYTFTSWSSVAAAVTLIVLFAVLRAPRPRPAVFVLYFLPLILFFAPLVYLAVQSGYGGYFKEAWIFRPGAPFLPQIKASLTDVLTVFWGSPLPPNLFAFRPFFGGLLNPILGALFFCGALEMWRTRHSRLVQAGALALFLLLLPGALSGGMEMFRIVQTMPFFLLGAAFGGAVLWRATPGKGRWWLAGSLFLASAGLDAYHLFSVYHGIWTHPRDNWFASKSVERLRAYDLLQELQKKAGPGYVLSELVPDIYDQSLPQATYAFNTARNPVLPSSGARWAAILINLHYQPYLAGKFPEGRWFYLAGGVERSDGGLMLGIVPFPSSNPGYLNRLIAVDRAMHSLVGLVFDHRDWKSREPVLRRLSGLHPLFQGDPFLEACFWEKTAENEYGDRHFEAQVSALTQAVQKGYPAAHLYNGLGALSLRRGQLKEARKAFRQALEQRPSHTSAAAGLALLDDMERTGLKPRD